MESEGQKCQRRGQVAQHHHPVIDSAVDHPIHGAEPDASGLDGHQCIHSILIGDHSLATADDLMHDLAGRISNRIQLTTDGDGGYLEAVDRLSDDVWAIEEIVAVLG